MSPRSTTQMATVPLRTESRRCSEWAARIARGARETMVFDFGCKT